MNADAKSSVDSDEFLDASTTAEEFRRNMATKVATKGCGHSHQMSINMAATTEMDPNNSISIAGGGGKIASAAVDDLYADMNQKSFCYWQEASGFARKMDR